MDFFYVKVGNKFYAEHADGTAYLADSYVGAFCFHNRKAAALVAAGIIGGKVYRPRSEQVISRLSSLR